MEFEKFLEEYDKLNIEVLEFEQLKAFREIFVEQGMFDKALELSELIYKKNSDDEYAIVSYVDNLMQLDKMDEALIILYNSKSTAQTLFQEGLIYKQDRLYDVAEEKFKRALELVSNDEEFENIIRLELSYIYMNNGNNNATSEVKKIFENMPSLENYENYLDMLAYDGKFEEVIDLHKKYVEKYDSFKINYSLSFAYNQLEYFDKSKEYLFKSLEFSPECAEVYMRLGFMSKGEESIKYFEKYLELQGMSNNVYLRLISLYKEAGEIEKIRALVRDVLTSNGIDFDTLYIAITALKNLYETEKVYEIYNKYDLVKQDSSLLILTLSSLMEEDEYIDFVLLEVKKYHDILKDESSYYEFLNNLYEESRDSLIKEYIVEIEKDK